MEALSQRVRDDSPDSKMNGESSTYYDASESTNVAMTTESAICEHASTLPSCDDEPWGAIRRNFVYVSQRLRFSSKFLSCLYERSLITRDDFHVLGSESVTHEAKVSLLLIDLLPRKPSEMFLTLCDIFRVVGQSHVAQRLEMNPVKVRSDSRLSHKTRTAELRELQRQIDELHGSIARVETEKRVAVKRAHMMVIQERTRADNAKARADAANRKAEVAESLALAARRQRVAAEAEVQVAKSDAQKAWRQCVAAEARAQQAEIAAQKKWTRSSGIMWTNLALKIAAKRGELVKTQPPSSLPANCK
ncbi:uncharacterized protein LOC134197215 isoform X2 [Corticium candelabrum]|nr:uncharacterized protein LOC134197215 isoform X2 [Corticium candelabrum]